MEQKWVKKDHQLFASFFLKSSWHSLSPNKRYHWLYRFPAEKGPNNTVVERYCRVNPVKTTKPKGLGLRLTPTNSLTNYPTSSRTSKKSWFALILQGTWELLKYNPRPRNRQGGGHQKQHRMAVHLKTSKRKPGQVGILEVLWFWITSARHHLEAPSPLFHYVFTI